MGCARRARDSDPHHGAKRGASHRLVYDRAAGADSAQPVVRERERPGGRRLHAQHLDGLARARVVPREDPGWRDVYVRDVGLALGVRVRTRGSHGDRPVRRGAEPAPPGRRLRRPVAPQLLLAPEAFAQSGYVLRWRRRTVQRAAVSAARPGQALTPTARRTECRWW